MFLEAELIIKIFLDVVRQVCYDVKEELSG